MTLQLLLLVIGLPNLLAQLVVGEEPVTRSDKLPVTLTLPKGVEGTGKLTIEWRDSYDRIIDRSTRVVTVSGSPLTFSLPLDRAVALQNFLTVELNIAGETVRGTREFFVTPESNVWDDYQIIMYYAYKPEQQTALRDVGITAGKISSNETQRRDGGKRWYQHGYRFYCDQISTFFYAAYHTPMEKPKHRQQQLAEIAYQADRSNKQPFYRKPCFHDKEQLSEALRLLKETVAAQKHLRPFFYAHTDEGGVGNLVEAIDFCFAPASLEAMREWLLDQYGSLDGINRQWGTDFKNLADVVPFTTDEMMARGEGNLSPWSDHRTFMNKTFADVLRLGTEAVESVDPDARTGLVGCQMPGAFGGYDYWLLSQAMTAIEPYNIGNNREIWRSLAPDKPAVTTAFGFGEMEVWRLWYQMLHGDLGIIIYDEKFRYLNADGSPTSLGASIAPTYKELTGGLTKQLHYMQRVNDPIGIHYSHPSVTAHWMIEARPEGEKWIERGSASERKQSDFLRLRESSVKLIEDNLHQYRFIAYGQLENGELDNSDLKVLLLPQSIAMSEKECQAIRRFVQRGGMVIADCRTALMDQHGKTLPRGQLDELFGIERRDLRFEPGSPGVHLVSEASEGMPDSLRIAAVEPGIREVTAVVHFRDNRGTPVLLINKVGKGKAVYLNAFITDYHRWRLRPPEGNALRDLLGHLLGEAGVKHQYRVTNEQGRLPHGVEIHPFAAGALRVLALHRNFQLRVSELGPPEYQQQDALEKPMSLSVNLGEPFAIYDQRKGQFLGVRDSVTTDLPKYEPTVLALLPARVGVLSIEAPDSARRGELIEVGLSLTGQRLGDTHAFRVQVLDPEGQPVEVSTRTLVAHNGKSKWAIPFAVSDASGSYTLLVSDVATGVSNRHKLTLR